jgi:Carboxypeptidase regulatory-like domain/TonB-dependent Receptor Plug Domain
MTLRSIGFSLVCLVAIAFVPSPASAQNAEIAGVVRDSSGAVLPGVAVEAVSPALIEKTRTVFTDAQGQYRIIALQAGTYKVTFTLTGFGTAVREGIVLTASFAATVNVAMSVGALQESVTVSGQSPLLDVQTTSQKTAIRSELLNELPTGRSFQNLAILVPGVQIPLGYGSDVGGTNGNLWQTMTIHGSRDDQMPLLINGMPFNNMNNTGGGYNHTFSLNAGATQEMTITTSGSSAESRTSGVVVNNVSKEGGNKFSANFYGEFTSSGLQSNNLGSDLRAKGVTAVNRVKQLHEINPTIGGPLIKDKLWFYGGYRGLLNTHYDANSYNTINPGAPQYCSKPEGCLYLGKLVPDSRNLNSQDFAGDTFNHSGTLNLTWQADAKDKFNFYWHLTRRNLLYDSYVTQTPEATQYLYSNPDYIAQISWTNPVTSKFLLEAGGTMANETWWSIQRGYGDNQPVDYGIDAGRDILNVTNGPAAWITKYELANATLYGASITNTKAFSHQYNVRLAANYVTGSHAIKVGMQDMFGTRQFTYGMNNSQYWIFNQGAPLLIYQYAYPVADLEHLKAALGIYAQDRWTLKNLTLNYGLRFDYHNAGVPAQNAPAIPFVAAQSYPAVNGAPDWKDIDPRLGATYDIGGRHSTVVRANWGRYVASESTATATANNPINTRVLNAFRLWTDSNGDFLPDCNLTNPGANGECGGLSAPLGQTNATTHWDPSALSGWGVRPSDNELLLGVQQQLTERAVLDVQWSRHSFNNLFATEHLATPASAYDSYCLTAPVDPSLPGGGGNQICGFTDLKPAYFGVTPNDLVTSAKNLGKVVDLYTGFDVNLNLRLKGGGSGAIGVSTGRERTDYCDIATLANVGSNTNSSAGKIQLGGGAGSIGSSSGYPSPLYCNITPPYQPDWKGFISYPLPWFGLRASGTWQNRIGPQILASEGAANALNPTLGRAFTLPTASLNLIAPGSEYGERINQIDVRLAKSVTLGRIRAQVNAGAYNLLNSNATMARNNSYTSGHWNQPTVTMQGRIIKFGFQLDY